jgi:glutamyl-tRNA reductase
VSVQKQIVIVGLNHRSAPIEVRESVAFEHSCLESVLAQLRSYPTVLEAVILSTCNRVEVIAAAADSRSACSDIAAFLEQQKADRRSGPLHEHVYAYRGVEAVRHLFRVAASLDSMVLGEPQILGQLKQYYDAAQQAGTVGAILHRLFHRSFSVAKRVRSETTIGSGAVSVSSVAADLARRIFDRFDDKTVLLLGAGKMGDLMARHLRRHGVRSLMVTNRTFERAVALAESIQGSPIRFEDFARYLKLADLVIGCTGAAEVLIDAPTVERVLRERKQRAMLLLDIGDRRNFDPQINDLDNAYLYNIDDLKSVAEDNRLERAGEAEKAEAIVHEEVAGFVRWMDSLGRVPTITALRHRFEEIRRQELERSLSGALKDLSAEQRAALDQLTTAMVNKLLHAPISQLKKISAENGNDGELDAAALKRLFDLEGK